MKEYRTAEDIIKEAAKAYMKLGKLLDELHRMIQKTRKVQK